MTFKLWMTDLQDLYYSNVDLNLIIHVGTWKARLLTQNARPFLTISLNALIFFPGKHRQVEVKLKCKPSDSPSAVSLYLLEPKTCE